MRKRLTEIVVSRAKPAEQAYTIWDQGQFGLGLRILKFRKTWTVMHGKERKRVTLGHYPAMSLADAREAARRYLARVTLKGMTSGVRVVVALEEFLEHTEKNKRWSTGYSRRVILKKHFEPLFALREVGDVTYRQVMDVVKTLSPGSAPACYSHIRAFMSFCVQQGYIETSPLAGKKGVPAIASRERVLSLDEVRKILRTAIKADDAHGRMVTLLAFTAQRRGQIIGLTNDMIELPPAFGNDKLVAYTQELLKLPIINEIAEDVISTKLAQAGWPAHNCRAAIQYLRWGKTAKGAGVINFPAGLMKSGKPLTLPISPTVAGILDTELGQGGIDLRVSLSRRKAEFDEQCGVTGWVYHDWRRTFSTLCATPELNQTREIIERVLAHSTGGVRGVYDRYDYLPQMRDTLNAWDAYLCRIIG